ncbi:glycosyltransferase family 4 protein [Desulfobacula phenolica]|uniref:Glycosyltransferase involved in cell wall bisynthesis n=1 Tax=Desulfobacula phenolica TaxID=90732 RepID=A0A1H2DTV6_9BACT|nr:glycosyltransferase family 4 protein [Desulfobacula phenolica]SDT86276.1 Glycosyltransferase involved in cell wall bisynthesis [Desulfobacula phenolica]
MKILITLPLRKDPGGVASYYNSILPYMHQNRALQIETIEIGSTHGKKYYNHQIIDQIRFIKTIISIRPDVVHINPSLNFNSFIRDGLFVFWAKKQKIQVVIFFHGWQKKFEKRIYGILKLFFNFTYKKADLFILLGSEFKSKLRSWGISKPVYFLTTAVNEILLDKFSIQKKITRMKTSKSVRLLFLSRLEKEKGVFETIDAFKLLIDKKYNITLSIAGDGSVTKQIDAYVTRLGLNDKIFMLGYLTGNKKANAFSKHDIYCLPSYSEGMPNSILEAMAFGMPVITTPVGGIKDFFEDDKMGCFSESINSVEVAECIKKILSDKDKLCDVSYYNYNYAKQNFMASKVAAKLNHIYQRLNTQ